MKTEVEIEERIAELEKRVKKPWSSDPTKCLTFEEHNRLEIQIDTLHWVLVKGYTIWLE